MLFNVLFVDFDGNNGVVVASRVKGNVRQKIFHNGMQTARAYILGSVVYILGNFGDFGYRVGGEMQIDVVDRKQSRVLRGNRVLRLGKNVYEVVLGLPEWGTCPEARG